MSNEIIRDEIACGQIELLPKSQAVVENKVLAEVEIDKVISVKSVASVLHSEVLDGEIHLSGKLLTTVVFLAQSNTCQTISNETEWVNTIKNDKIKAGDFACVSANVISAEIGSVSSNEISTQNTVEFDVKLVSNEKLSFVSGGGENLFVLNEEYSNSFLVSSDRQMFELEFEIDARIAVEKVLSHNVCAKIKNIKTLNGMMVLDGDIFYDLFLNLTENELKIINEQNSFTEEIVSSELVESSTVDANLSVVSCQTQIEQNKVKLRLGIMVCFSVYNQKTLNFVSDAFSAYNEVNLKVVSCAQSKFKNAFSVENEISGNVLVGQEGYEIRKVIGALPKNLVLTNIFFENGELNIEGIATFTAIYVGVEDDTNSVDVELPFVIKTSNSNYNENLKFVVKACLGDIKTKIRKANEIEILAELEMCVKTFEIDEFAFVSDIEIGEEKLENESALSVYTIKAGDTLFDVAKKLSISLDSLLLQNPSLSESFEEGEQIVVYRQKMIN